MREKQQYLMPLHFALYGEASGNIREANMFRSKYAKEGTPTYVEFTFYIKKNIISYSQKSRIYTKKRKRAKDLQYKKADAILTFPDNRPPVTKIKRSNKISNRIDRD